MMAITCAQCGRFFDDFGTFEAHQIDTCRNAFYVANFMASQPKDAILGPVEAEMMSRWIASLHDQQWRSTVTVRDALFLRQIGIDPL